VSGLYSDWRETQDIVPIEHPDREKPVDTQVALGSGTQ